MAMEILLFQIGNTFTNGGYLNISIRLQLCCQVHPLVPLEWCRGASRWGHIALDAWTENTDFGRTKKNLHESHLEKQIPLLMLRRQCFIIFHSWLCNGFCLLYLTKKINRNMKLHPEGWRSSWMRRTGNGPGDDFFFFLGGAGWFQWFVYIFVDPYTWGNDSKVWGIFVQMGWKHQKGFYWSDGLGWVIWVRLHLPKCMRWDLIISYSNEWR